MSKFYTPSAFPKKVEEDNYEKGRLFEEYIIKLFHGQSFYLKKWRKSQKLDDIYSNIDLLNPDIELELVFTGAKRYRFAVECKWKSRFYNGRIKWAKDHQICAYRIFQDRTRIPVFVAIGIGGEPGNPEKLFLTPLDNIFMYEELYEENLIPYKRKNSREFVEDVQLKLSYP